MESEKIVVINEIPFKHTNLGRLPVLAYAFETDDASSVTIDIPDGVSLTHAAAFVNWERDPTCYVIPTQDHKTTFDFFGIDTSKAELFTAEELYKMRKDLCRQLEINNETLQKVVDLYIHQ